MYTIVKTVKFTVQNTHETSIQNSPVILQFESFFGTM